MNERSSESLNEGLQAVIGLDNLKREQKNLPIKISVLNLPPDITPTGIKNLFLCIGEPLSIHFSPHNNSAIVEFESLNQAELAVRDLNRKPPYNLSVSLCASKKGLPNIFNAYQPENLAEESLITKEKFIEKEVSLDDYKIHTDKSTERPDHLRRIFEKINYDSSYRIHRRNCDFKVKGVNCISKGRGYFYSGDDNFFLGGKEKYSIFSESTEDCFNDENECANCSASTTKFCDICSTSFCSMTCLMESLTHKDSSCLQRINDINKNWEEVELKSMCNVVITYFYTLKTVFIRLADDIWNDRFFRMCNDVMTTVTNGEILNELPKVGKLYLAKFYEDACYYRAKVTSILKGRVNILFYDFGNRQETNIEDLKPLPERLRTVPSFAVKVNLINIPDGTSEHAIDYCNKLTAENVPLLLKFDLSYQDGVTLIEKESGDCVNERVKNFLLPSWKKDLSVLSKTGEVYYVNDIKNQELEVGKTYNLIISFLDKLEFESHGIIWVVHPHSDDYQYLKEELRAMILEYCEYLQDDCYLPRERELCLAKENGEWQRCVNLKTCETSCYLSFIDIGKTAFIGTTNIRKIICDFLLVPSQAIRCTLFDEQKLMENVEVRNKLFEMFSNYNNIEIMSSVIVKQVKLGVYHLEIPALEKLYSELE